MSSPRGHLLPLLLMVGGCSHHPSAPLPLPPIHRTVRIVVSDSLGLPASDVAVRIVSKHDSAGVARVALGSTDAQGAVELVLVEDSWGVHALQNAPRRVAGATFTVPGRTRPAADTIQVVLTLHTPSVARGRALLGGRTDHSGTSVDCPPVPAAQITDSTGAYVIDLLPPGFWTITMFAFGFRLGVAPIHVTAPGETLSVRDVVLTSDPLP